MCGLHDIRSTQAVVYRIKVLTIGKPAGAERDGIIEILTAEPFALPFILFVREDLTEC